MSARPLVASFLLALLGCGGPVDSGTDERMPDGSSPDAADDGASHGQYADTAAEPDSGNPPAIDALPAPDGEARGPDAEPGAFSIEVLAPEGPNRPPLRLEALVEPTVGLLDVRFAAGGWRELDVASPYEATVAPGALQDGPHTVGVTARWANGSTATAHARILLDSAAPSVVVLSPQSGGHYRPSDLVAFRAAVTDAQSPDGIALAVALDSQAPILPRDPTAPVLLDVPPTNVFPVLHRVRFTAQDLAGNAATGEVSFYSSRQRWATSAAYSNDLAVLPAPLGGAYLLDAQGLSRLGAEGSPAWAAPHSSPQDGGAWVAMFPRGSGLFALRLPTPSSETGLGVVALDETGRLAFAFEPTPGFVVADAAYHTPSDRLLWLTRPLAPQAAAAEAPGFEVFAAAASGTFSPLFAGTSGRFAVDLAVSNAAPCLHVVTLDEAFAEPAIVAYDLEAGAEPAWSAPLPASSWLGVISVERDIAVVALETEVGPSPELVALGPSGVLWSFGVAGEALVRARAMPGGTLLTWSEHSGALARLRLLGPNGAVLWLRDLGDSLRSWDVSPTGDVLLVRPSRVERLLPDGQVGWQWEAPRGGPLDSSLLAAARFDADGGAWVVGQTPGAPAEVAVYRLGHDGALQWEQHTLGEGLVGPQVVDGDALLSVRFAAPVGPDAPPTVTVRRLED
jgi:hypothetical protein